MIRIIGIFSLMILSFAGISQTMVLSSSGTDQIRAQLTTSLSSYDAANADEWVEITSTEWTALSNASWSDETANIFDGSTTGTQASSYTIANDKSAGSSSYIFAFATRQRSINTETVSGWKVKLSDTVNSGYTDYGNSISIDLTNTPDWDYFVMKTPSTKQTGSNLYMALYYPSDPDLRFIRSTSSGSYGNRWATGDTGTLGGSGAEEYPIKYMWSTTKQW